MGINQQGSYETGTASIAFSEWFAARRMYDIASVHSVATRPKDSGTTSKCLGTNAQAASLEPPLLDLVAGSRSSLVRHRPSLKPIRHQYFRRQISSSSYRERRLPGRSECPRGTIQHLVRYHRRARVLP